MRREMLDKLGRFDAGSRLYGEDIDLAYRAAKGAEIVACPGGEARARHVVTNRRLIMRRTQ